MKRLRAMMSEQQEEAVNLDAANLPVRRSASEGGKELEYGE